MINKNTVLFRAEAWRMAQQLVDPIIESDGLEPTKSAAPAFSHPSTWTKVEQHLDHIQNVADWLLQDMLVEAELTHIPNNNLGEAFKEKDD